MIVEKGIFYIGQVTGFSPTNSCVDFTDDTQVRMSIDAKNLVRLYEGLKIHIERQGMDFNNYCDKLFDMESEKYEN